MIRVLIASPNPILGQGLESWLRQQRGLDVVGWEADAGKASDRIQQLKPDVVILDTGGAERTPLAALMRLLADRPGARIIGVNLEDNCISIYGSEQHAIDCVEQLLEAIRSESTD
jgi:DNA-binding NarL/FixJ family response regulator